MKTIMLFFAILSRLYALSPVNADCPVYLSLPDSGCSDIPDKIAKETTEDTTDTISVFGIAEVKIEQPRHHFFREDKKVSLPDSITMVVFSESSLGDIITAFTPAYLNASGSAGATSSVFLRGMNSYQTSVLWNGFLLNSLTLGTVDFSSIPVMAADDISLVHGASGSITGSGNFGGSVLLNNKADWNNNLRVTLQSELGSYDSRQYSFRGRIGNPLLQYHISLFSHESENNFRYRDAYKHDRPVVETENNSLDNKGLIQNLFIQLPGNNILETGLWYQVKEKGIPEVMGTYLPSNAMQSDSSLRIYGKWTKKWHRSALSAGAAYFDELMSYRDRHLSSDDNYSVNTRIETSRLTGDINYRIWLLDFMTFEGGVTFSSGNADAGTYIKSISENRSAAISAMKIFLPGFKGNASIRKEYNSTTSLPLLFAFGGIKELPFGGMELKFSYSDQFRIPTFNDKHWTPGGNPDLLPESGFTADAGIVQRFISAPGNELTIEINTYRSRLHNMIQWAPSSAGPYWHPVNRREVEAMGMEASVLSVLTAGYHRMGIRADYSYSRSFVSRTYEDNGRSEGKRLIYIPGHTAGGTMNYENRNLYLGLTCSYTGKRYTESDNNPAYAMPAFTLFNFYGGYSIITGDISGTIRLRIMNMFNTSYQAIRSYPMPGRTVHMSLTVGLNR